MIVGCHKKYISQLPILYGSKYQFLNYKFNFSRIFLHQKKTKQFRPASKSIVCYHLWPEEIPRNISQYSFSSQREFLEEVMNSKK